MKDIKGFLLKNWCCSLVGFFALSLGVDLEFYLTRMKLIWNAKGFLVESVDMSFAESVIWELILENAFKATKIV